jgi:hypothetical protein
MCAGVIPAFCKELIPYMYIYINPMSTRGLYNLKTIGYTVLYKTIGYTVLYKTIGYTVLYSTVYNKKFF